MKTSGFLMISRRIEINQFAEIRLIIEAKFGENVMKAFERPSSQQF